MMEKRPISSGITSLILLFIVFVCGCWTPGKSIRLQYKHKPGEILKYKVATVSNGSVTLTGMEDLGTSSMTGQTLSPVEITAKTTYLLTQKVIGVDDTGAADIEINYDSFNQEIKIGNPEFPSPIFKEVENPFYNLMAGRKVAIKITKDGSLLGIKGLDEIFDEILTTRQAFQMP